MSFLFGGQPKMSSEQKLSAAETEVEMISDMFNRMPANASCDSLTESCTKKCIPTDYREGDLNKGESVCLDRCVSKFFDVNIKVSEKMQGDAAQKQGGGGMGLGM